MMRLPQVNSFFAQFWPQRQQAQKFTAAINVAYRRWTVRYPDWANALFDEHFLGQQTAHLREQCQQGKLSAAANVLANRWADQFRFKAARRTQLVAELTPAAANFLHLLKVELCTQEKCDQPSTGGWGLGDWTKRGQAL